MKKTVIVKVTQQHIDKGKRHRADLCPIALACKAMGLKEARVLTRYIWNADSGDTITALSLRAQRFVANFDRGRPVRPAVFRLTTV